MVKVVRYRDRHDRAGVLHYRHGYGYSRDRSTAVVGRDVGPARVAGHPFYARLTTLLDGHDFDRFVEGLCQRFYAPVMGRPSLAPGCYFRLLLVGYFEGIDSERGIAWRTVHGADAGDTTTIIETAIAAAAQIEAAQAHMADAQPLKEIVGDKGYHSNQTLIDLDAVGIRSYVSEPDRGRRDWSNAPEAQAPVNGNRRRIRGPRGRRLMRQRGERVERSFAHVFDTFDTGGMRCTHLRGHTNILKRLLIHAGGFNLGLVMRRLIGVGTPRGLQGRVAAVLTTVSVLRGVVRRRVTPIWSSHRLIPAVRGRLASLTTCTIRAARLVGLKILNAVRHRAPQARGLARFAACCGSLCERLT